MAINLIDRLNIGRYPPNRSSQRTSVHAIISSTLQSELDGNAPVRTSNNVVFAVLMDSFTSGPGADYLQDHLLVRISDALSEDVTASIDSRLGMALRRANAQLFQRTQASNDPTALGASALIAALSENEQGLWLQIAHVGACRAYLIRSGRLYQLTAEHTWGQAPGVTRSDASGLARYLGADDNLEAEYAINISDPLTGQTVRHLHYRLEPDDRVLLCTPGLPHGDVQIQAPALTQATAQIAARTLVKQSTNSRNRNAAAVVLDWPLKPPRRGGCAGLWLTAIIVTVLLVLFAVWLRQRDVRAHLVAPLPSPVQTQVEEFAQAANAAIATNVAGWLPGATPTAVAITTLSPTNTPSQALPTAILTPQPSSTPSSTTTQTETPRPTNTLTATPKPTATNLTLATPMPTATNTPIPTPSATSIPTVTFTPTPEATETAQPEIAATGTASATISATDFTATATPTSTTETSAPIAPEIAPPELVSDSAIFAAAPGQKVTFRWRWSEQLQTNWGFEIRIWQGAGEHNGAHNAALSASSVMYANGIYSLQITVPENPGEYRWAVAVVQLEPYVRIGQESSTGEFSISSSGNNCKSDPSGASGGACP